MIQSLQNVDSETSWKLMSIYHHLRYIQEDIQAIMQYKKFENTKNVIRSCKMDATNCDEKYFCLTLIYVNMRKTSFKSLNVIQF